MLQLLEPITDSLFSALKIILKVISKGNRIALTLLGVDAFMVSVGAILLILIHYSTIDKIFWSPIASIILFLSFLFFVLLVAYSSTIESQELRDEINNIEERARNNEPQAAWELAQRKLENYLNRNLVQVRWIFVWTIFVMLIGFAIIIWGIYKVFDSNNNFNVSIVSTSAGILIEIIGATFLFVYKSTMQQAKNYVSILERINVVGMTIQVIDSIETSSQELKEQAKLDLAKQIINFYKEHKT